MVRVRWLAIVSALLLTFPASRGAAQQISGIVRDATSSAPLVGAIVSLGPATDERTARTDANGSFSFSKVPAGTYALLVRRLGYEPSRTSVDVPATRPVDVGLERVVSLDTVRVRAAGQGIYGAVGTSRDLRPLHASIQILGASSGRLSSDSTGHFFAAVKTPGPYLVRATADGYVAQTVSVTVQANEGVEVALLLDSATGPVAHGLEMAYADFNSRLLQRGLESALVPRTDLTRYGAEGTLVSSLISSPSFARRGLRFGTTACVFVDGRPMPGFSLNTYAPAEIEMVEIYGMKADYSLTLARRWPRAGICGDTGRPPTAGGNEVVRWVVIWLKH
ncbi:MAG: carboxypeptidase regulatory-like domain-containing protein [Gemmatimonadaceae bacterium]